MRERGHTRVNHRGEVLGGWFRTHAGFAPAGLCGPQVPVTGAFAAIKGLFIAIVAHRTVFSGRREWA